MTYFLLCKRRQTVGRERGGRGEGEGRERVMWRREGGGRGGGESEPCVVGGLCELNVL